MLVLTCSEAHLGAGLTFRVRGDLWKQGLPLHSVVGDVELSSSEGPQDIHLTHVGSIHERTVDVCRHLIQLLSVTCGHKNLHSSVDPFTIMISKQTFVVAVFITKNLQWPYVYIYI